MRKKIFKQVLAVFSFLLTLYQTKIYTDFHIYNICRLQLNSLPNDKILDWPKFKAFADDKINVTENLKFVENIVGKGENAGYQHFLPFSQCFQKFSFTLLLKVGVVW